MFTITVIRTARTTFLTTAAAHNKTVTITSMAPEFVTAQRLPSIARFANSFLKVSC